MSTELPVVSQDEKQARRRRRKVVLAVLATAVLLVAGPFVVARQTVLPDFWARRAVAVYFAALEDRDWEAVEKVVAPEALGGTDQRMALAQQLRAGDTYGPPQQVQVVEVAITGSQATVEIEYLLQAYGVVYGATLQLRRSDKLVGRALARWWIVDPFGTLNADGAAAAPTPVRCDRSMCVSLNGIPLPAVLSSTAIDPLQSPVIPGNHQLSVQSSVGRSSTTVVVRPGSNHHVR